MSASTNNPAMNSRKEVVRLPEDHSLIQAADLEENLAAQAKSFNQAKSFEDKIEEANRRVVELSYHLDMTQKTIDALQPGQRSSATIENHPPSLAKILVTYEKAKTAVVSIRTQIDDLENRLQAANLRRPTEHPLRKVGRDQAYQWSNIKTSKLVQQLNHLNHRLDDVLKLARLPETSEGGSSQGSIDQREDDDTVVANQDVNEDGQDMDIDDQGMDVEDGKDS